jgi:hypothetical protein
MNMLAVPLLLLPVAAAFALIYSPAVQASINPGNEIMTASDYAFQSDTFSAAGAIGSIAGDAGDPVIITGRWSLVQDSSETEFSANLTMVKASGAGYRTIQLSNMSSTEVTVDEEGTVLITGVLDVTINGTEKLSGVNATIALAKFRALNMTLSEPEYLDEPIYGTVDQEQKTTTASTNLMPEGNSIYGDITEKFRLPQLPNPFR